MFTVQIGIQYEGLKRPAYLLALVHREEGRIAHAEGRRPVLQSIFEYVLNVAKL